MQWFVHECNCYLPERIRDGLEPVKAHPDETVNTSRAECHVCSDPELASSHPCGPVAILNTSQFKLDHTNKYIFIFPSINEYEERD